MADTPEVAARIQRDRDDFGRVFKALTTSEDPPDVVADTYVNIRRHRTRNSNPLRLAHVGDILVPPKAITASGGGGLVIQCVNGREPKVRYALKVVRPSLLVSEEQGEEQERALGEFVKHAPLSHQNVARVFSSGEFIAELPPRGDRVPRVALQYMIVEWIDSAMPLRKYLASTHTSDWNTALSLIIQAFEGLEHLHRAGLVHWDVKSENFLVAKGGIPKLSDLGSARQRDKTATEAPTALSTRWNVPLALLGREGLPTETGVSSRRMPIQVPDRSWDTPWLDLWMLARDLNRLFCADIEVHNYDEKSANPQRPEFKAESEVFLARCFPENDDDAQHARDLISIVLRRLLRPKMPLAVRFYDHASEVIRDLKKLLQPLGAAHGVQELRSVPQRVMRIPVWNNIPYTERLGALFNSPLVQRLGRHLQLGALVQVYPGASHRRSEHSAGVFAAVCEYVRALYADRRDPFWRLNIEARDVDALLLAAIAHDIGHLSFGHFLEEMKGLFRGRTHESYAAAVLKPTAPSDAAPILLADRELLRTIVKERWVAGADPQDLLSDALTILGGVNAVTDFVNADAILSPRSNRALKFDVLHTIIDSAIDADKLDYLARDAHHCNVQYSKGVDVDRFLQSLTTLSHVSHHALAPDEESAPSLPRPVQPNPHACIGVTEKGVAPVESILIARYHMFSAVYWQHTARALTATLQFVVQEYVAADAKHCEQRLGALIDEFRQREDIDSLNWLVAAVTSATNIKSKRAREVLGRMCAGLLGDREAVYWPAFELRYGRTSDAAALAIGLMMRADEIHNASSQFQFVEECRRFRNDIAEELSAALGARITFGYGDLLVDVPPAGKDQIDNIFVIADGAARPIQDVSPVADAVRDSFRYWVRKVRVFLSPSAWKACDRAGISRETIHGALWTALHAVVPVEDQAQLQLGASPPFSSVKRRQTTRSARG